MASTNSYEKELAFQADRRKATTEFIKITSDLWYDKSIEIVLFKNQIIDKNVSDIIHLHEYAGKFVQKPISIFDSVEILRAINSIKLPPSKLDIGKLTYEYHSDDNNFTTDAKAFVTNKLKYTNDNKDINSKNVIMYGFERIGRLLIRELMAKTGKGNLLRLRAIVISDKPNANILEKSANLLRIDPIHGKFKGTVDVNVEKKALIINGTTVHMIYAQKPEDIDYTRYDILDALVIDNSRTFKDEKQLSRHLRSGGTSKVLLTAPGKEIPNIVHGINHVKYDPDNVKIYAASSCTINAITPILKVVEDSLGIIKGHIEIIYAYTNDQNLEDDINSRNQEKTSTSSIIITEVNAGDAVAKVLPSLKGKLTSNAIKVPVSNGSLAILNLDIKNKTSISGINTILKKYALEGDLVEQIKYSLNKEMISSDIIDTAASSIYDSQATIVDTSGKNIVLYIWYDNEYGYSHQVIRLAKYIAKVRRYTYY